MGRMAITVAAVLLSCSLLLLGLDYCLPDTWLGRYAAKFLAFRPLGGYFPSVTTKRGLIFGIIRRIVVIVALMVRECAS